MRFMRLWQEKSGPSITARRRAGSEETHKSHASPICDSPDKLVACAARRPREWNHVAHVGKPRHVSERALEAQAEARVRHGAVAAQVAVPGVRIRIEAR